MLLFGNDPATIIAFVLTAVFAFAYHELGHALVADRLGDNTPREYGRISLNPIVHLDMFGMIMLVVAGFGWATTPVNPYRLRGNPRTSMAIVAVAGPAANLIMAFLLGLPLRLNLVPVDFSDSVLPTLYQVLIVGVQINLILAVFNMMPIPPLDGFTILVGLLPAELAYKLEPLRRYGTYLLLAIILFPSFLGINIFGTIVEPFLQMLYPLMTGSG